MNPILKVGRSVTQVKEEAQPPYPGTLKTWLFPPPTFGLSHIFYSSGITSSRAYLSSASELTDEVIGQEITSRSWWASLENFFLTLSYVSVFYFLCFQEKKGLHLCPFHFKWVTKCPEYIKDLLQLNNKGEITQLKMAKDLNRHFSKKDTKTANRHMKRCLISLVMRELQIKTIWALPLQPLGRL